MGLVSETPQHVSGALIRSRLAGFCGKLRDMFWDIHCPLIRYYIKSGSRNIHASAEANIRIFLSFLIATFFFSCYVYLMTIEQTVTIPANHRLFLELPRSIPSGVRAQVKIDIPAVAAIDTRNSSFQSSFEIEEVRQLLQKEMTLKGTSLVNAASGDGWEAYVRERYAEL